MILLPCKMIVTVKRNLFYVGLVVLASITHVHAQSSDNEAPAINLEFPTQNNAIIQGDATFSGTVTDAGGSGIREVRYLIKDLATGEYVSQQGDTELPRVLRKASLELTNPSSGSWSIPTSLPDGSYRLYVRVRDNAFNSNVWAIRTDMTIESVPLNDETPPTITLLQPGQDASELDIDNQVLMGRSEDGNGAGVVRVFFAVRDLSDSSWVDVNGNIESPRVLRDASVILSSDGSADWSIALNLPAGQFRVYVSTVDASNNTLWWGVRRDFNIDGDSQPPSGNTVFTPSSSDITDPYAFYLQDGYETVDVIRMDVATRTTAGTCTPDDDSGCTLADVLADVDGSDDFKVDIPVKLVGSDFPDDGLDVNAGFRQRGSTSRAAPQKSFRVRLTDDVSLWRNEERIQLNKHPYDQSRIINKLSFDLMSTIPHLPSLRTQFVNLFIDDGAGPVDQGLYTHVEAAKKEYLINRGRDKDDNIYKAEFFLFSASDLAEMAVDADGEPIDEDRFNSRLEIERGDDHRKVVEMLTAFHDPNQSMESVLDRYFNRNNVMTWLMVNMLLGQQDAVTHNYFLYNPLGTEKFYFLPWDYDSAFREEPQLSTELNATELEERIYWGYSRYHDNLFVSELLKIPGMHSQLVDAAQEIRRDYITDAAIVGLTNTYVPLVRSIIAREPDIGNVAGVRSPQNMGVWDSRVASLPGVVARNLSQLQRAPSMPLPPFLKSPRVNSNGIELWWIPAFEVTGTPISYDVQVSSTPTFEAGTIALEVNGIPDAEDQVEVSINNGELASGTWYYRVFARTSDPVLYQVANNRLTEGEQTYIGIRKFSMP